MGALDCPVDVIGDPSPELRLGLGALQLAEQGLAVFADIAHALLAARTDAEKGAPGSAMN